jgi:hypothetical protein
LTEIAIVTLLKEFVSPQHIPSTKPIIQQKPSKEFDFGHTLCFPYPSDGLFWVNLPEIILIIFVGCIIIIDLDERPRFHILLLGSKKASQ